MATSSKAMQASNDGDAATSEEDSEVEPRIPDPLKWFGILVPLALRASQTSFKIAATETIPRLANVANEMKSLEIEIRRTRKKIRRAV